MGKSILWKKSKGSSKITKIKIQKGRPNSETIREETNRNVVSIKNNSKDLILSTRKSSKDKKKNFKSQKRAKILKIMKKKLL